MKKTTYIMIGAIVGGFIAVLSLSRWYLKHRPVYEFDRWNYEAPSNIPLTTIGGEMTKTPLGTFGAIRFTDIPADVKIANYKGLAVCESDTATRPWLMTRAQWQPLIEKTVSDDTLTVSINRPAIADLYGTRVQTEDFILATVIVPRGKVGSVSAKSHTLYLDSVRARQFTVFAPDRLVLNVCTIGSLRNYADKINELKLDASAVDTARLYRVGKRFTVTCTTPESAIGTLLIDGVSEGKNATLKLKKANLGTLIWNPDDHITDVTLETATPINYIRKK
jgi:hypothetical protein